jgi:hypothetical protein
MKQVDNYIGGNTLKPMYKGLGNHTKDHLLTTRRFKLEQTTIDDFTNNDRLGQTTTDVLTCNDKKEQTITDNIADNNEKQLTTTCVLTPQYPYDVIWYMNEVLKNVRGGEGNVNDKENNTYPALRAHSSPSQDEIPDQVRYGRSWTYHYTITTDGIITPQEEDPRQARMTNYGIHTCYNTAARTKINDRANYYILNDYINPSLRSHCTPTAEDPRCARMTKINMPICTKRQLE